MKCGCHLQQGIPFIPSFSHDNETDIFDSWGGGEWLSPRGRGSAAKSSGWNRSSREQILPSERPGSTSALMVRSVNSSLGIISRSAVALNCGKNEYLHEYQTKM